jgi:hypothetical protein
MNSLIIAEILNNYNHKPYYNTDNYYISINDDRIGRIVSFKLYEKDDEIFADFNEAHKIQPLNTKKHKTKVITSLEDFKNKWTEYYNYNS